LEGQIALLKRESEKAAELFRKAREAFPAMSTEFHRGEALAYLQAGLYDESIQASRQAIGMNPHFALSYRDLGIAYRAQGDKKRCQEALGKFLELWKDADADDPEVKEARQILRELGG
jgi:tetratricopeptide (TPR) repeat protein